MSTWSLVLVVTLVWCLAVPEAVFRNAVRDATDPLPDRQRRGTSIFPTLPVLPAFFIGAALAIDALLDTGWGSRVVGGAHVLLGVVYGVSTAANARRLRGLSRAD